MGLSTANRGIGRGMERGGGRQEWRHMQWNVYVWNDALSWAVRTSSLKLPSTVQIISPTRRLFALRVTLHYILQYITYYTLHYIIRRINQ